MKLLVRLWRDETGFIISAELCLVATIVVIGLIVGLCTLRNQIVQELIAVGEAIGCLNTSYGFCGLQGAHAIPPCCWTGGSHWVDYVHFCHPLPGEQGPGAWEGGISLILPGNTTDGSGGQVGFNNGHI
jgi:Flp pilus assembly pilin Flp